MDMLLNCRGPKPKYADNPDQDWKWQEVPSKIFEEEEKAGKADRGVLTVSKPETIYGQLRAFLMAGALAGELKVIGGHNVFSQQDLWRSVESWEGG